MQFNCQQLQPPSRKLHLPPFDRSPASRLSDYSSEVILPSQGQLYQRTSPVRPALGPAGSGASRGRDRPPHSILIGGFRRKRRAIQRKIGYWYDRSVDFGIFFGARRKRLIGASVHFARHTLPVAIRPARILWHQMIGVLFLVLAVAPAR